MDMQQPVYTETNNCQDCYKCIRECPVKAIRIESDRASVVSSLCIFCGHCTTVCPPRAKKVRDDVGKVKRLLSGSDPVYISLAPSHVSEFEDFTTEELVAAFRRLGFAGVSETAHGAEWVSQLTSNYLSTKKSGLLISTACPAAVSYIQKYAPSWVRYLAPVVSPLLAHAHMLKSWYGKHAKIVFVGPCVAKKSEVDEAGDLVEAALTFAEVRKWFEESGITPGLFFPEEYGALFPCRAGRGSIYPVDGGMIKTLKGNSTGKTNIKFLSISGIKQIHEALDSTLPEVPAGQVLFLELLACEGGCINGPGTTSHQGWLHKNIKITSYYEQHPEPARVPQASFSDEELRKQVLKGQSVKKSNFSENDIAEALRTIGKTCKSDELNCGGCGYNSCREFAIAMLTGMAERQMCVSYMRKVANDKASVLLQRMPFGVVLVDQRLHIIECNQIFAKMAGADAQLLWEAMPGLKNADLRKLLKFHNIFTNVLSSGADVIDRDFEHQGRHYSVSVFTIQKNRIVCGIMQDLNHSGLAGEEVNRRIRKVIYNNMLTVQKVAAILGENAVQTQVLLNTLIHSEENERKP
ncbi:MAG: hypothetical protein PWR20_1041 [Bacteroidales bacterium]|nr:hypothetical protein [Bacteroidales bacterium]